MRSVADAVLDLLRELCHIATLFWDIEYGIIAKSVLAARLLSDPAFADPLDDVLSPIGPNQSDHTAKSGRPGLLWNSFDLLQ
jgi:hypothetical protein